MITSPDNSKLKLVRKLHDGKHRRREALFVTEGEDLLQAGLEAGGARPQMVLVAAGTGIDGEEVEPELLAATSSLGSGTRVIAVWPERWTETASAPCVFLHGVKDPGNVGAVIRSAHALTGGSVAVGPGCADPFSSKAVRASMGSVFGLPLVRASVEEAPEPRAALVPRGGEGLEALVGAATICLGSEREGLPPAVLERCARIVTIPLRSRGAESLNVAAAAAIACERISSPAGSEVPL